MIPHFNLKFPNDGMFHMMGSTFPYSYLHLCIFFGEESLPVFYSLLNWALCFLTAEF